MLMPRQTYLHQGVFTDFQVDSDIDFRNGGERLARSRSRVEDISRRILVEENNPLNNPLNNRRSKSRQSNNDVNHLIHNSNFAHHITDTSDPENHIGQQYNNLSGRLGRFSLKLITSRCETLSHVRFLNISNCYSF